jgi:hypothetical protein
MPTPPRRWWEHLGFHALDPADDTCLDLYLLTNEVEATLTDGLS